MTRMLACLVMLVYGVPGFASDDPEPKPAQLKWAERVAADFLDAGVRPQAIGAMYASAAALLSEDFRGQIEAANDTPHTFLSARFGTSLNHPESWVITSRELSPDADEAVFEGAGLDNTSHKTGVFMLRVSKEPKSGKWRVHSFGTGESKSTAVGKR